MDLSESLLQLPAGGQVVLSDTTFQRIGGRLHEVKLPSLEVQKPSRLSLDGKSKRKLEGQVKPDGQRPEQSSPANSRRSSMDTTNAKLVVMHCNCSRQNSHTQAAYNTEEICCMCVILLRPLTKTSY